TDRLARPGEGLPTPLPTLSSTTTAAHYALARPHPHQLHQQQPLHVAAHAQYPPPADGQVAYSYSSYSALSPAGSSAHSSWRPESCRRSGLAAV
ncbi:hypothetical protein PHLGIDRAFT_122623, partial [Phlebiopsis gigantea 11061_1 CR5-6]